MAVLFTNNAYSKLSANLTVSATSLAINAGDAEKFPSPAGGDWFPLTIVDAAGNMEVVKVTSRSGASMTIQRGQEGTSAKAFASGSGCDVRLTKGALAAFIQTGGNAALSSLTLSTTQGAVFVGKASIAIGDNDTGIRQNGDGILEFLTNGVVRSKLDGAIGTVDFYGSTETSFYYNGSQIWHAGNTGLTSGLVAQLSATAVNANNLNGYTGSYYLSFGNFTGQASDAQLPYDMGSKRFPGGIVLGAGVSPSGSLASKTAIVIGDSDTGLASGGDGLLELWANNARVLAVSSGGGFSIENVTWPSANGKLLAGVSNSSDRDQTDFPIGTVLIAFTAASNVDRNASKTLAHSGSTNSDFQTTDRGGAGTVLAGSWLCCGRIADYVHAFRRSTL